MKEDNNIDKLFREKLQGFSEDPPAYVWDGISEQLMHGRRKRRAAWFSWSAVAALVLLAFLAGWYFNESKATVMPTVVETETRDDFRENENLNANKEAGTETVEEKREQVPPLKNILANAGDKKSENKFPSTYKEKSSEKVAQSEPEREWLVIPTRLESKLAVLVLQNEVAANAVQVSVSTTPKLSNYERSLIDYNARQIKSYVEEKAGWQMGVNVSPGYASYSANHEAVYASNMTQEASSGTTNLSGGFSVKYKTSRKWSIESGIYYAQNGQQAGSSPQRYGSSPEMAFDAPSRENLFFNTAVRMENSHMAMNSTAGVIEIANLPAGTELAANLEGTYAAENSLITHGELSQVFDFVEIPLYMRYLLVDSKLDVELMGGVSAGLVVGNHAYLDNEQGMQHIGKTQDISTVNMSGTIGIGLNYALNKNFALGVEPRVNYYLNSINNNPDVDFRPYRIGVYTGLYYTF